MPVLKTDPSSRSNLFTEYDPKKVNDPINPNHYKDLGMYSAVHVIEKWGLGYHLGNMLKYVQRAGKKESTTELEDLKKARWYLQRKIHLLDPSETDPAA